MSARAAARAAKAKQLAAPADGSSSSSEEEVPRAVPARAAAFALLMDDDEEDDLDDEEDQETPVAASSPAAMSAEAITEPTSEATEPVAEPPLSRKAKKAKKRVNKKAEEASAAAGPIAPDEGDELEMLAASAAANASNLRAKAVAAVWAVDAQQLDAELELRRKFGGRAVRAAQRDMVMEGRHRGGRGRAAPTPRRVLLVTPKPEWGRPHGLIKMAERESLSVAAGTHLFSFEWSEDYVRLHQTFEMVALSSADPQMLMELLRQEPCHIGALLQLHEIATSTGQVELAAEYLQRALWSHEASYAPGFTAAWLHGEARLPYGNPTNRPFYRALHKYAVGLGRRGCLKAAVGTATLLLSLDRHDPTRITLWLDILALRAGQPHLIYLFSLADETGALERLPGWAFSRSLAFREMASSSPPPPSVHAAVPSAGSADTPADGDKGSRSEAADSAANRATPAAPMLPWTAGGVPELRLALLTFPSMLPAALQACVASSPAATALAARWQTVVQARSDEPPNGALTHLMALYWERANEVWSVPAERIGWLQREAARLLDDIDAAARLTTSPLVDALRDGRSRSWYAPGAPNPYRGCEFSGLRAEQVVIPEEEEAAPLQPPPPVPPEEEEGARLPADGVGGAIDPELSPLLEEAEALTTRVSELERLTAPHLRPLVEQRLKILDERLTAQMIAIDAAQVAEGEREAKRALTRRMDELCARVAAIGVRE